MGNRKWKLENPWTELHKAPPPKDSWSARHLPNGKLTIYGQKMLEKEKKHEG